MRSVQLTKFIKLTQGQVAMVSGQDYKRIAKFNWVAINNGYTFYAVANGGSLRMHRFILNLKANDTRHVDHIDRNGLNNQRNNLRAVGLSLSNHNKRPWSHSGIKGVRRRKNRWVAEIGINHRYLHLGSFKTLEEAQQAYAKAEVKYYGGLHEIS
jgi:hypothetical protein